MASKITSITTLSQLLNSRLNPIMQVLLTTDKDQSHTYTIILSLPALATASPLFAPQTKLKILLPQGLFTARSFLLSLYTVAKAFYGPVTNVNNECLVQQAALIE